MTNSKNLLKKDTPNRPYSIITPEINEALKKRLDDPENYFNRNSITAYMKSSTQMNT